MSAEQSSGVTLKDISQKMNVSMTSVHRAIYGKEGVSDKLRKQIIEAAEQMGYEPNYAASSIKRKAIRIAVVLPSPKEQGTLYYAYLWKGYRNALKENRSLNVETDEYEVENEEEQIKILKEIADEDGKSYNGILTFSYTHSPQILRQYERLTAMKRTVMVLDDRIDDISGLYCIPSNDRIIGQMCGEVFSLMLPEKGTILVSSGRKGSPIHVNTMNGLKQYLKEQESNLQVKSIPYEIDTYEGFCKGLKMYDDVVGAFSLIARNNRPMIRALEDTGMIGKLRVIGADLNLESAEFLRQGKIDTLVYKNPYDKGVIGFNTLIDYLVKHTEPPQNIQCVISMVFKTSLHFYEDVIQL